MLNEYECELVFISEDRSLYSELEKFYLALKILGSPYCHGCSRDRDLGSDAPGEEAYIYKIMKNACFG